MGIASRIEDPNIFRIYKATFGLGVAYGMAISLTSLFLAERGFKKDDIGSLAAWFAFGIVLLSLPMGTLIERYSAKTTLMCSLAGYACTVTLFPFLESYASIAAIRLLDGACSVGVWVSSETILLARTGRKNKAFVTSLYAIVVAIGYVVGPLLARALVAVMPFSVGFIIAGVIAFCSSLYVAKCLDRHLPQRQLDDEFDSEITTETVSSPWSILYRIKSSCYATFAYGYFQASVVLFLPLYLVEQKGVSREETILVPAFFAAGMLLFSNVGGRLGDRRGHLGVMRILAAIGVLTILGFVFLDSFKTMAVAVFVAGATLATISPLSLALQGVVTKHAEYARANAIYNAFYATGMLLGPPISSYLFVHLGGVAMLYHLAALWGGFVFFSLVFYRDDPAVSRARGLGVEPAADEPDALA
jgi:MFS family permease